MTNFPYAVHRGCTELYLQGGGSKPVARSINQDAVSGMTQLVQLHINDWPSITALPRTLFRNLPSNRPPFKPKSQNPR